MPLPSAAHAGKTSNVYVGFERYAVLTKAAIQVSYRIGQQVTTSQVAQYLADNYLEEAVEALIRERSSDAPPQD